MAVEITPSLDVTHLQSVRERRLQPRFLPTLFTVTAFVTASLLFVVQPMVARLVLPHFGGAATVWSTTSLFFQLILLGGYLYTHVATTRLGVRLQAFIHVGILLSTLAALPVALPSSAIPGDGESPALVLLRVLAVTVGLPFAVISTSGPLLQRWYSLTSGPRADDPYFLYAASNLGSFAGLLAYPLAVEPLLTLDQQRLAWSAGFGAAAVLLALCAAAALRGRQPGVAPPPFTPRAVEDTKKTPAESSAARPGRRDRARWFLLALLPSTLMLGVTAHISTDIAAIPLMWVVPLALYLATFIAAFSRRERSVNGRQIRLAVTLAAVTALVSYLGSGIPVGLLIVLQLAMFTVVALTAHFRLAALRPSVEHLTQFYLVVALGGATGALLNGLLAPVLFDRVWEYPLALVGSMLLGVGLREPTTTRLERRYGPRAGALLRTLLYVCGGLLVLVAGAFGSQQGTSWLVIVMTLIVAGSWLAARRPLSAMAAVAVVIAALTLATEGGDIERSRTFYGAYRVTSENGMHKLVHGTTVHGTQRSGANEGQPTTYYARSGPLGDVFTGIPSPRRVGVVGMGAGTIAAYGTPGESMTFYEIDPEIVRIANDRSLFTYLVHTAANVETVIGDGRLQVAKAPQGTFDLLVLDAFSSDSIPVHLLTQEAFETYADKLNPHGVLAVHVSNRMFDLEPVVSSAADRMGWTAAVGRGKADQDGATDAVWIVMSADPLAVDNATRSPKWRPITDRHVRWTDNYSSVLAVLRNWL